MADQAHPDVQALQGDVARLTQRIQTLERTVWRLESGEPAKAFAAEIWREPAPERPVAPAAAPPRPALAPTPAPKPSHPAPPPRPPAPQIDWRKHAEQLFAART